MKLHNMEFGGFRTFAEPTTFDFGDVPGLYFLEGGENEVDPSLGSNGVGKSTVWSALCWILFGKTADGLKAGDLKSWQSEMKGYYGKLWIGEHEVHRTWKPNKLTLDGEVVEQKRLEELLNLEFDTFVSSVVLAQGGEMFLDLTAARKLTLFTAALGLNKWIGYSAKAKATADSLLVDLHTLDTDIARIEGKLEGLRPEDLELKRNRWYNEHREEIKTARSGAKSLGKERTKIHTQMKKATRTLRGLKREIDEAYEVVSALEKKHGEEKKKADKMVWEVRALLERITEHREHLADVKKGKGTCGQCGQKINRGKLRGHIQDLDEQIDNLLTKREELEKALSRKEKRAADAKEALNEERALSTSLKGKRDRVKKALATRQQDFALMDSAIKTKELRAKELEGKENPFTPMLRDMKAEIKKLKVRLASKETRHGKLTARHANSAYWIQGFREVRLYLIEEALEHLEVETNRALSDLGFGTDWRIQYAVDKKTKKGSTVTGFNVAVKSPQTDGSVPWAAWSGGEKQRLKIAGSIGFISLMASRTGVDVGIEVYDEPTQHLSPQGIDALLETLRQRALETGKRIWLVDHHTLDYGDFAGRTVVTKTELGSTVEERR